MLVCSSKKAIGSQASNSTVEAPVGARQNGVKEEQGQREQDSGGPALHCHNLWGKWESSSCIIGKDVYCLLCEHEEAHEALLPLSTMMLAPVAPFKRLQSTLINNSGTGYSW
eukprot:1157710-Pelagomonas_calceolata.AAC.8